MIYEMRKRINPINMIKSITSYQPKYNKAEIIPMFMNIDMNVSDFHKKYTNN